MLQVRRVPTSQCRSAATVTADERWWRTAMGRPVLPSARPVPRTSAAGTAKPDASSAP